MSATYEPPPAAVNVKCEDVTPIPLPNVELTGPRRHGALAVRPMMYQGGRTARVPCRSGSG